MKKVMGRLVTLYLLLVFYSFCILGLHNIWSKRIAKVRDDKKERSKTFWEIPILKCLSTLASKIVFFGFTILQALRSVMN